MISGPGSVRPCPRGLVLALLCFAKYHEKWFFEIVDEPWWFLDEFWWVLTSFPLIFECFRLFRWFPRSLGLPSPNAPLALAPPVVCEGVKETLTPKPPYQPLTGLMV